MSLEKLLSDGDIELFQSNRDQIASKIEIADRELTAAEKIVKLQDPDTDDVAYKAAYNAILQAGYALIYNKGYRPKARDRHHFVVQQFVEIEHAADFPENVLSVFGDARQTRNTLQYDTAGIIANSDVSDLIAKAKLFLAQAKKILNFS